MALTYAKIHWVLGSVKFFLGDHDECLDIVSKPTLLFDKGEGVKLGIRMLHGETLYRLGRRAEALDKFREVNWASGLAFIEDHVVLGEAKKHRDELEGAAGVGPTD
jgi:hypothetical protein